MTVLLLTGFLATILMRVLKNDFVRFGSDEETGTAWPQPASAQKNQKQQAGVVCAVHVHLAGGKHGRHAQPVMYA